MSNSNNNQAATTTLLSRRPKLAERLSPAELQSLQEGGDGATLFDPPDEFDDAVIGVYHCPNVGAVPVYDYNLLVELRLAEGDDDYDYANAASAVEFNTVRSVPYTKPRGPIIVMEDMGIWEEDYEYLEVRGKLYRVIEAGCDISRDVLMGCPWGSDEEDDNESDEEDHNDSDQENREEE